MAERERIRDEAVESVSGGVNISDLGKAIGLGGDELRQSMLESLNQAKDLIVKTAEQIQQNAINPASGLEAKSNESNPGRVSAVAKP